MIGRTRRGLLALFLWVGVAHGQGPPAEHGGPLLLAVRFQSDAPVDVAGLEALLPFEIGKPLTDSQLTRARQLLEWKGIFRSVSIDTEQRSDGVDVIVRLQRKGVVNRIDVRGNKSMRRAEVWRSIRLRPEMIFDDSLAEDDQQRILSRYERIGFVGTEVSVDVEASGPGEVNLTYEIREGVPQIISAVSLVGDPVLVELPRKVRKLVGTRRTRDAENKAEKALLRALRAANYYEADVRSIWQALGEGKGILDFEVEAGPLFSFKVSGNHAMSDKDLLDLEALHERLLVTDGTWRELARQMTRRYQEAGYYKAMVDLTIDDGPVTKITFRVTEGRRYAVKSLSFSGNRQVSDEQLRATMRTRPHRWWRLRRADALVDQVLDEDVKRLGALYRRKGFESARILDVERHVDDDRGSIDLTVRIDEGSRTIVDAVDVAAIAPLSGADLKPTMEPGKPLTDEGLRQDRQLILIALSSAGFPQATVEAQIERGQGNEMTTPAVVRWVAETGTRQAIGAVVVAGNIDTRDRAILRELPLATGAPVDPRRLLEGQAKVYRLGLFRRVSVRPIGEEGASERDIAAFVTERPPGTFRWGGGYNTRDGFGTFLEVGYNNLGGMARRLSLRGEVNLKPPNFVPDQYAANLSFVEPRLFDSPWRFHSSLRGQRNTQSAQPYNIHLASVTAGVSRSLTSNIDAGVEAQTEFRDLFDVKNDVVLTGQDEGRSWAMALIPFLLRDRRNDPSVPTRGFLQSARVRYALPGLSNTQLLKTNLQHTRYLSLPYGLVLSYAGRIGWAHAISGASLVPLADRFFLGGQTTVRGFKENSIGPRGSDGNRTGGDLTLSANVELLVPLVYGFGAAFFVDGGGLYLVACDSTCQRNKDISDTEFTFDNFRRAAGAGLRYRTPVGPIRLDYGIKLDRRSGESFGRFHFGVGVAF